MYAGIRLSDKVAIVGPSAPIALQPLRAKALLALGIWGLQFLVVFAFALSGHYPHAMVGTLERLSMSAFGASLCIAIGWITAHVEAQATIARSICMLVGATVSCLMWSLFAYSVVHLPGGGAGSAPHIGMGRELALDGTVAMCLFTIWSIGCLALDYRSSVSELRAAHSQALASAAARRPALERTLNEGAELSSGATTALWVPVAGGRKRVPLAMIEYVEADHDYVRVHAATGRHLLHRTLEGLERELEHGPFMRVHRSFIVNSAEIVQLRRRASGLLEILLTSGARLPVGRTYSGRISKRLLEQDTKAPPAF